MRAFDFSHLFRSTVGFDRLFDLIDSYAEQSQGYPPYNIERSDETHYRITLAVAGFAEKDLSVEVREGVLSVTGKRDEPETSEGKGYLYQGIAGRAFERRFQLAEHVEVREGVLSVTGKRDESEASEAKGFLYQGIAGRAFERRFQLAEHVEVREARLENGLLHIDLERVIPEEKKPRQIPIGAGRPKIIEGSAKAA